MRRQLSRSALLRQLRRWVVAPLVGWVGQGIIHLVMLTCRLRVYGVEHLHRAASSKRCILMFWHNRLAIVTHVLLRKARQYTYAAVISNSRDGDILAAVGRLYRQGYTIRVAHNARHRAVKAILKGLEDGTIVLITPDGPRGPRYSVKAGIAFAAKATKATIVPFTWSASRFWQLPTWDKTIIPKPFSKVAVTIGEGVDVGDNDLHDTASALRTNLLHLDEKICQHITPLKEKWPV